MTKDTYNVFTDGGKELSLETKKMMKDQMKKLSAIKAQRQHDTDSHRETK